MGFLVGLLALLAAVGLLVSLNGMFSERVRNALGIDTKSARTYFLVSLAMFVLAPVIAASH